MRGTFVVIIMLVLKSNVNNNQCEILYIIKNKRGVAVKAVPPPLFCLSRNIAITFS